MTDAQSTLLAGRYRLGERIGKGGAASVYRARDERLGVDCAVKILSAHREGLRASLRRRLLAEARIMAKLRHPHVLAVTDVGEHGGRDFVVMALADGGSLADVLKSEGPLAPARAVEVGLQLLSALEAAHGAGVVHRDVKPQNLLLTADGRVQLADFGIALIQDAESQRRTRTGVAMGSMAFMAPEQRMDAARVTVAADVYAVGSTLYTLLTNRSPMDLFVADEGSARWEAVPSALLPILFQATRYDAEARFASAAEMAIALQGVGRELETGRVGVIAPGSAGLDDPSWISRLGSSAMTGGTLDPTRQPGATVAPTVAPEDVSLAPEPVTEASTPGNGRRGRFAGIAVAVGLVLAVGVGVGLGQRLTGTERPSPTAGSGDLDVAAGEDAPSAADASASAAPTPASPAEPDAPSESESVDDAVAVVTPDPAPRDTPEAPSRRSPKTSAPRRDQGPTNRADVAPQDSGPPPLGLPSGLAGPSGQWSLNVNGRPRRLRIRVDGAAVRGTIEARLGEASVRTAVAGTWSSEPGVLQFEEVGLPPGEQAARYELRLGADRDRIESGSLSHPNGMMPVHGSRDAESSW